MLGLVCDCFFLLFMVFFFFQAEDGIRDIGVTGVQTCALPICALGEVRDLDVHLERLSKEASRNGEVLEEVVALLRERRGEDRRRMLGGLGSNRDQRPGASFSGTLRRRPRPTPPAPPHKLAPGPLRDPTRRA